MDIDPARLEVAHAVCQGYARELGVDLRLEKTLDRRVALQGAEFVVTTALATGHHRLLILLDPWSCSAQQARAFLDEILALPYHAHMRQHYR